MKTVNIMCYLLITWSANSRSGRTLKLWDGHRLSPFGKSGKQSFEYRYSIISTESDKARSAAAVWGYWRIENTLHWVPGAGSWTF